MICMPNKKMKVNTKPIFIIFKKKNRILSWPQVEFNWSKWECINMIWGQNELSKKT